MKNRLTVKANGHTLELEQQNGKVAGAKYCMTCDSESCERIAKFNALYEVKVDPHSSKGWHILEARG